MKQLSKKNKKKNTKNHKKNVQRKSTPRKKR